MPGLLLDEGNGDNGRRRNPVMGGRDCGGAVRSLPLIPAESGIQGGNSHRFGFWIPTKAAIQGGNRIASISGFPLARE